MEPTSKHPLDETGLKKQTRESSIDATGPMVHSVRLEPISLSRSEAWFKLGAYYVVLKFNKNSSIKIALIKSGKLEKSYVVYGKLDCMGTQIILEGGIDVCQALSHVIDNYSEILEQYELEERAKALEITKIVAPRLPTEWEQLIYSISKIVMGNRIIKTFYVYQGNREVILGIYCYENGYYRNCDETMEKEVEELVSGNTLLDVKMTPSLRGNVLRKIEGKTLTPYEPAKRCLLFKDKVFCWDDFMATKDLEKSLKDPSPDLIVTHRIPWRINPELYKQNRPGLLKYIPPATQSDVIQLFKELAPKSFKAFLDWVKYPDEKEEEAYPRVVLLLEIIGYTLYPHEYPFHKAILLVGEGNNGKTTYLKLIEKILGIENVASVTLTDLDPGNNKFASADLYGKLANISSEPAKGIFDVTRFKMLTGEDLVRFERKHRDAFFAHNYAKMIFAANELPQVTEDTYAFWRRWIVINFPNRFPQDKGFFERTFTPEEVEGIIICALHAFRLVLERNGFTEAGVEDPREEWLSRSNPVYRVIKKMMADGVIEFAMEGFVVKKDLYELYKRYAMAMQEDDEDIEIVEQKDFTRYITRFFPVRAGDRRIQGRTKHVYIGVRIKNYEKARELVGELETPSLDLASYSKTGAQQ